MITRHSMHRGYTHLFHNFKLKPDRVGPAASPDPADLWARRGKMGLREVYIADEEDILIDCEPCEPPEDLAIKLPPVPFFDLRLLPAALRPMVDDVAKRMQVPVDAGGGSGATLAGVCGRRAMIQPKAQDDSWEVVPNLWRAIVAEAGMMKSLVIKAVIAPARKIERGWRPD